MLTGLDECFSKKVSYYTGVLVVSSAYTSFLSITGKCDAHQELVLVKLSPTSKQHVFGVKTVTVYRVEI